MTSKKTYSRGADFLGMLGSRLKDLQGVATLAHELIQNAEDAVSKIANTTQQQTTVVFRVNETELIVENGGIFSDCGHQDQPTCPWKSLGKRRCDFHGFRLIGDRDKLLANEGLKGAFGFGFTAVYQVTDHPELISSGRHWIIYDEENEKDRIVECDKLNCKRCSDSGSPGTRFVLPWADKEGSEVRLKLGAPAVTKETPKEFVEALKKALPQTILFLDHIRTIEVYWQSDLICRVSSDQTSETNTSFSVSTNGVPTKWALLSYDFKDDAAKLRLKHPVGGKQPSSLVKIAVPNDGCADGLIFAFLPTQLSTRVPFHINADFFPSTDRKRILLEKDYQGDWNRAAITAGAIALRDGLLSLREHLGPAGFWNLLQKVRQNANYSDSLIGSEYWTQVATVLQSQPVVPVVPTDSNSRKAEWLPAAESRLVPESESVTSCELFRELQIRAVHPDVLGHREFLTSGQVGVRWLSSMDLASQLAQQGFTGTISLEDLPKSFWTLPNIKLLWKLIGSVTSRELKAPKTKPDAAPNPLSACSILQCTDGKFRPWLTPYKADPETRLLFQPLNSELYFASDDPDMRAALERYIQTFKLPDAISAIASCLRQEAANTASNTQAGKILTKDVALELLKWFEKKTTALRMGSGLLNDFRKLKICPTGDGLKSFDEVVLPGDFDDPMGITSVADVAALKTVPELTKLLNLNELRLRDYITKWLPQAFRNTTVSVDKCEKLLKMLAKHQQSIDILTDARAVRTVLRTLRFIPCSDGELRAVDDCLYFDTPLIRGILSNTVSYVDKAYCSTGVDSLLKWLGVEDQARLGNVVDYMLSVAKANSCPSEKSINILIASLDHLNRRAPELAGQPALLTRLKNGKWVPAESKHWDVEVKPPELREEWCVPSDVCFFDTGVLVETTGRRLLFSDEVQSKYRALLELLGVKSKPGVSDVIKHWQRSAQIKSPVNVRVYQFINEALEKDKAIAAKLQDLKTSECLFDIGRKRFFSPVRCFSKSHPFGTFRELLRDDALSTLNNLLLALEVPETPTWQDAIDVIREISCHESSKSKQPVTEELKNVLNSCWRLIQTALHDKSSSTDVIKMRLQEFSNLPVVCGYNNIIVSPSSVFFRDREKYAEAFSPLLDAVLIPMSPKAARALMMAGVRKLSESTSFRIIQDDHSRKEGTLVSSRLQERASLLSNLIEWASPKRRHGSLPDFSSMKVFQSSSLQVEFTFSGSDKQQKVVKEDFAAFDDSENTLWYCLEDDKTPWAAIAFEISRTYVNDDEIAQLSAAVSVALEPDSLTKAQKKLRHLGFPKIELCDEEPLVPETSLTLGIEIMMPDGGDRTASPIAWDAESGSSLNDRKKVSRELTEPRMPERVTISSSGHHAGNTSADVPTENSHQNVPDRLVMNKGHEGSSSDADHDGDFENTAMETTHLNRPVSVSVADGKFVDRLSAQSGATDQRKQKKLVKSAEAERRSTAFRERKERVNQISREEVLIYLKTFYSEEDRLKCQMMSLDDQDLHDMPFWKSTDQMYEGKEELFNRKLPEILQDDLPEDEALNLFLCPNCAAIYTKFVAMKLEQQRRLLAWIRSNTTGNTFVVECSLAGRQSNRILHFHPKHLDDIRHTDVVSVEPEATELDG
jgi:hypothetical protein